MGEKNKIYDAIIVYLLIDDVIRKMKNCELFIRKCVKKEKVSYNEIREKYYITNIDSWNKKMKNYIECLSNIDINRLLEDIRKILSTK